MKTLTGLSGEMEDILIAIRDRTYWITKNKENGIETKIDEEKLKQELTRAKELNVPENAITRVIKLGEHLAKEYLSYKGQDVKKE